MNKRKVGEHYEDIAVKYLCENGVRIIARNYRSRFGEIDIVGYDGQYYIFIEVKFRRDPSTGDPSEAVDIRKQYRISRVADFFRINRKLKDTDNIRFDVISILGEDIVWYRNAFDYIS